MKHSELIVAKRVLSVRRKHMDVVVVLAPDGVTVLGVRQGEKVVVSDYNAAQHWPDQWERAGGGEVAWPEGTLGV